MKNCVFTIVAKNYIGLAQVLEQSIKKYYKDFDFFIVVADDLSGWQNSQIPSNVIVGKDSLGLDDEMWKDMSFKYSITEFCTSIKPISILYFLNKGYNKVIYLDPDIYFYSSIAPIFDELDKYSVVLSPHILSIPQIGCTDSPESDWLLCGIYNLGFCGFKNDDISIKILNWWQERLIDHCFMDNSVGEFTDQKWMDFLPSFLSSSQLLISRDAGRDVAPWNFFERRIEKEGSEFWVLNRNTMSNITKARLMFVHYSGYDYLSLMKNHVIQKNILSIRSYEDIDVLLEEYRENLLSKEDSIKRYLNAEYSYNSYDDGVKIDPVHRRLYAGLKKDGYVITEPFSQDGAFYKALYKRNLLELSTVDIGKLNPATIKNSQFNKKMKMARKFFRLAYSMLGARRFFMMIRMFSAFRHIKSQSYLIQEYFNN